jgi:hypothetical protein
MADTIFAERGAVRGMERELRNVVSNLIFSFLDTTKSPAVLSNHSLVSLYPSMRKRLGSHGKTSLLEGTILPAIPKVVRLALRVFYLYIWLSPVLEVLDIVFGETDGHSGNKAEPVTLSLTITVSANATPSATAAINTTPSDLDDAVDESSTTTPAIQSMAANAPVSSLSQGGTPVKPLADSQMSSSLDRAEEAMDTMKSWKTAVSVIKQVMDHVSPIVEVRSFFPHVSPTPR